MQTLITSGMSGRDDATIREVIVTVRSSATDWASGLLQLLEPQRAKTSLAFGEWLAGTDPLSCETEMIGLGFYVPAAFERSWSKLPTSAGQVQLVGGYPLYAEEICLIEEIGFKEFGKLHPGVDWLHPQRINLAHYLRQRESQQRLVLLYHDEEDWEIYALVPQTSTTSQLQRLAWQVMREHTSHRKLRPKEFGVESVFGEPEEDLPFWQAIPEGKGWRYLPLNP